MIKEMQEIGLPLSFESWVSRMKTPQNRVDVIRELQTLASDEVTEYFNIAENDSFVSREVMLIAQ